MNDEKRDKFAKVAAFMKTATEKLEELEPMLAEGSKLALLLVTPGEPNKSALITAVEIDELIRTLEWQRESGLDVTEYQEEFKP